MTTLLCLATSACVISDNSDSSLLVTNHSDFEIHEMYVTDVNSSNWGPNLLSNRILYPNESIELGVECGTYDALLVDETNAECEIDNLDLCFDDADWIIRNNSCAVFEARAKEAAAKKLENIQVEPKDVKK